jgi:hypothetical protein
MEVEVFSLLHFCQFGPNEEEFPSLLARLVGVQYDKSDKSIYSRIRERQPIAIHNARNLLRALRERGEIPERNFNPSTNVHELVEFLNELCELGPPE